MKAAISALNWPFSLDWLPSRTYLVGGAVRDALLNRHTTHLDLDFVLPQKAISLAQKIAQHYQAGFVILDHQREIARVVFPKSTVDFATRVGENITTDLQRRDFTVNAIAYDPHHQELFDPLGGIQDLESRQIKMIARANLQDDPLRLLRAYRQSAQLNFQIDNQTRQTIAQLSYLLAQIAPERVRSELNYLLNLSNGSFWLTEAWQDGLLASWLPAVTVNKLNQMAYLDTLLLSIATSWPQLAWGDKILSTAKLALLVAEEPLKAETTLIQLKYPREVFSGVKSVYQHLPRVHGNHPLSSLREQYFFFSDLGKNFPILALVALAKGINPETIKILLTRYTNPSDLVAHPRCLVTGHDLIKHLQIKPGPIIGNLIQELEIAQIEGKISTQKQALDLAKTIIEQNLV